LTPLLFGIQQFSEGINGLGAGENEFSDNSSNLPASWIWGLGDGITSSQQNLTHTFVLAGTYIVCLTATNSLGGNTFCVHV
jgi:PKD repeat protein